mmetsp:Transcript_56113/g.182074  ORF Transcript_56113/g.182074 Transcript_56113/m.182074 type:complete len:215 (+) Transcript_56113:288-932(+)
MLTNVPTTRDGWQLKAHTLKAPRRDLGAGLHQPKDAAGRVPQLGTVAICGLRLDRGGPATGSAPPNETLRPESNGLPRTASDWYGPAPAICSATAVGATAGADATTRAMNLGDPAAAVADVDPPAAAAITPLLRHLCGGPCCVKGGARASAATAPALDGMAPEQDDGVHVTRLLICGDRCGNSGEFGDAVSSRQAGSMTALAVVDGVHVTRLLI